MPKVVSDKVKTNNEIKKELMKRTKYQKQNYDKTTKGMEEFNIGELVWIQIRNGNKLWSKSIIVETRASPRHIKVKIEDGGILIRNYRFIEHIILMDNTLEGNTKYNIIRFDDKLINKKSSRIIKTPEHFKNYKLD